MRRGTIRLWVTAGLVLQLQACAYLQQRPAELAATPAERLGSAVALAELPGLKDVDVLVRLDNGRFRQTMLDVLERQAAAAGSPAADHLEIHFGRQSIGLSASLQVPDPDGDPVTVLLSGDVRPAFSGSHLIWLPQFLEARTEANPAMSDGARRLPPVSEWLDSLVAQANRDITDPVIILGRNTVDLNLVPLGRLEVGAEIAGSPNIRGNASQALGGVFTVAGSAILIEPEITSIALDLTFVPNISSCSAELQVSRAAFAREIRAREPVGVSRFLEAGSSGDARHFFTEVKGARAPATVVHYWFADGLPVAVEELPVGPSERWRTWSSKTIDSGDVRNWEVIVVEKSSGCILHSQAIRTDAGISGEATADGVSGPDTFAEFRSQFHGRLAGYSILAEAPSVALIEVRRAFLGAVLNDSIRDLTLAADFDLSGQARNYEAGLAQLDKARQPCQQRECRVASSCGTLVSHCRRQYDTRDCSTCLFHNPLNNRCMSEAEDPICVAAKAAQNEALEEKRQACIRDEERERLECETVREQEQRTCQLEAQSATGACESVRAAINRMGPGARLAQVHGDVSLTGGLQARFSGFQVGDDLRSLSMRIEFLSEVSLGGHIRFEAAAGLASATPCLSGWNSPFRVDLLAPPLPYHVLGAMSVKGATLVTDWPALQLEATLGPSPLRALFTSRHDLLAACEMGLRTEDIEQALVDAGGSFFSGAFELSLRPTPSRIVLGEASIGLGADTARAQPKLGAGNLRFELGQ